jgi:tetratricopeptide (TPR) repeat protein
MFIFLTILFDVGYSTCRYVELLKRYYLADQTAISGNIAEGQKLYEKAEQLRSRSPFFSIVSGQLFSKGQSLATLQEARSRALWSLGEKEKALLAQKDAARLMPKSFKVVLREARLCLELGKVEEAQNVIADLINKHKHALLPRLYLASSLWQNNQAGEARKSLKEYMALLDKEYFSPPPVWPSSGEEVLHELFYRDDINFLFPDKFLSANDSCLPLNTK